MKPLELNLTALYSLIQIFMSHYMSLPNSKHENLCLRLALSFHQTKVHKNDVSTVPSSLYLVFYVDWSLYAQALYSFSSNDQESHLAYV